MKPEIMLATLEHVQMIAENVRVDDRCELWAAYCQTPEQVMVNALNLSNMAWAGLIDDVPVCMFGVVPASILSNVGRPWMVGTKFLDVHPFVFLRRCKGCVKMMRERFESLENYVDVRNVKAIEWLRWMGFSFNEPELMGPFNMPFIRFTMEGI
jgi:hypothetical protein